MSAPTRLSAGFPTFTGVEAFSSKVRGFEALDAKMFKLNAMSTDLGKLNEVSRMALAPSVPAAFKSMTFQPMTVGAITHADLQPQNLLRFRQASRGLDPGKRSRVTRILRNWAGTSPSPSPPAFVLGAGCSISSSAPDLEAYLFSSAGQPRRRRGGTQRAPLWFWLWRRQVLPALSAPVAVEAVVAALRGPPDRVVALRPVPSAENWPCSRPARPASRVFASSMPS